MNLHTIQPAHTTIEPGARASIRPNTDFIRELWGATGTITPPLPHYLIDHGFELDHPVRTATELITHTHGYTHEFELIG